ncbi:MAG: 4Fe-4S dicluster domain-containing protein [Thermodesulfobacteriota bacterium]
MIRLKHGHNEIKKLVEDSAGQDFNSCLHCLTCTNACPFVRAMDYNPNAVLRLIQLGMEKEVLECSTIWVCVGCNTCCHFCPMAIDIPAVMDSLRHAALERNVTVKEPDIVNFHKEVLNSVKKYGRTHKLEIMMRYKLKSGNLFSDFGIGLKMLQKRKLDLTPSKVKNVKAIKTIFE